MEQARRLYKSAENTIVASPFSFKEKVKIKLKISLQTLKAPFMALEVLLPHRLTENNAPATDWNLFLLGASFFIESIAGVSVAPTFQTSLIGLIMCRTIPNFYFNTCNGCWDGIHEMLVYLLQNLTYTVSWQIGVWLTSVNAMRATSLIIILPGMFKHYLK